MATVVRSRGIDRNFWLGVSNGVFVNGGEAFFNSSLVLAPFLAQLGASPIVIGLIPALRVGLYFLPQLLVANRLSQEPMKLKYYRVTSTVRNVAFFVMTGVVLFASGLDPAFVALVVVVMVAINAAASGVGGVPFADVTAKIVPHARLGTFWAVRNVLGGAIALAAGFVLRAILDSDIPFPRNFGYIFLCGTVLATIGNASFSLVKEPPGEAGIRRPLLGMFKYIPDLLKTDALLRRFLRVRFLGLAALLAEPFYGIHALNRLEAPESALGIYIIAATVVAIVANFAFRGPANSGRNVMVLRIGYACYGLAVLSALLVQDWRLFSLVFMFAAIGNAAVGSAAWNLLYAIAPAAERALYIGIINSMLAVPSLLPIVAGIAIVFIDVQVLFIIAGLLALAAFGFSMHLPGLHRQDQLALRAHSDPAVVDILREARDSADD